MRGGRVPARFDDAIRANEDDLLRYFERRMSNPADAAEAFGELLLIAWRNRRRMPEEDVRARMWLFATARNVLLNARRSLSRRSAAVQRFIEEAHTRGDAFDDDETTTIRDAIGQLPQDDAELIRLVYWDGFSTDEAARILQLNPSTTRSRLARIKQHLRTLIEDTDDASAAEGPPKAPNATRQVR